jgi:hypothetical protein
MSERRMAGVGALLVVVGVLSLPLACDPAASHDGAAEAAAAQPIPTTSPPVPPETPDPPEIVIDAANVSVGSNRVATGEAGLADKLAVFLTGQPTITGNAASLVAMRNAKPSQVFAVLNALRKANAASAIVATEARDGTTQKVPMAFPGAVADCVTVAWIARNGAIDVWAAGGGTAHRVVKGLAGPDMTLGTEAMRKQWSRCGASELLVGSDDVMPWGLVFDLATAGLHASGTHPSTAVLVTHAVPGRKLALE